MTAYKIVIAGAGGLVGSALVQQSLNHEAIDVVVALVRKPLDIEHPKLQQIVVDFDNLQLSENQIDGEALFCCLGTTRRKTPDLRLYTTIDHDYPLNLAKIALKNRINQYHFISSIGADTASKSFYTKLKGETEADLQRLPLPALFIYQPSLLTGSRKELRLDSLLGGPIMKLVNPLLLGRFKKYRSISAEVMAAAMLNRFVSGDPGVHILPPDEISALVGTH